MRDIKAKKLASYTGSLENSGAIFVKREPANKLLLK